MDWAREEAGCALEIARRPKGERGFTLLPKRWVVERTPAWLGGRRRMSKDCERRVATSEAWIRTAMINLTLRRLAAWTELSNTILDGKRMETRQIAGLPDSRNRDGAVDTERR